MFQQVNKQWDVEIQVYICGDGICGHWKPGVV